LFEEVSRLNASYESKKEEDRERTKTKIKLETEIKTSSYKLKQARSDLEEVYYLTLE
jgi:hypothetical protein